MKKNMTKAEMMAVIERMSAELEALKAEKETAPAEKSQTSAKRNVASAPVEKSQKVVLPVRKGKAVGFDGWLNNKVYRFNRPTADALGGVYNSETRTIDFPTAKAATEYCNKFVATLTDTQYADQKKAIDDAFKARATARAEKVAANETSSTARKGKLIGKSKSTKASASAEPVKKPEWRERKAAGEKPFADFETYKDYWHACVAK